MEKRKLNDTYTILEEIGSGGGGIVYKAYHERLHTYVVVKQIKEKVKGKLEERAEADILKKMKHTYLPQVYDFLEIDGEIYTVIDFISGKSLDKVIEEKKKIPYKQVLKWAKQLAEALDYLHRQNPPVIHSDIKPANIMLTSDDNICLIDFNISLAFDSSMRTATGISKGYSPPEQYQDMSQYYKSTQQEENTGKRRPSRTDVTETTSGDETEAAVDLTEAVNRTERFWDSSVDETEAAPEKKPETRNTHGNTETTSTQSSIESTVGCGVDARSDIYSLGATLYHLLTGIKPSRDFEKIRPVDQCGIEISEGFAHIITKMMELLPDDRYQNGSELLETLQNIIWLDSEYRAYRKRQRNKKLAITGLYFLGAALSVVGVLMVRSENNIRYNHLILSSEAYIEDGSFAEAEVTLSQAEELLPSRAEAYEQRTHLFYQQGNYEGCIAYAEELLRDAPYQLSREQEEDIVGNIYYTLGNSYLETEDYGNAALNLGNAISLYDQNSLYYRDFAIAQAKTGNVEAAEAALENAVLLGLGEDSVYMVQGEIACARGTYELAEEYLQKAISFAETDSLRRRAVLLCDKVYRSMGEAYIDQDIILLEQEELRYEGTSSANSLSERLADAYVRKAESSEEEQEFYYGKALDKFQALYSGGYVTKQIMENIAIIYEHLDDFEQAEEMLLVMAEQYPDSYEPYKRLAFLEADRQQEKKNANREYQTMKGYYDKARKMYADQDHDQEMQMLDAMMQDLKAGNWL